MRNSQKIIFVLFIILLTLWGIKYNYNATIEKVLREEGTIVETIPLSKGTLVIIDDVTTYYAFYLEKGFFGWKEVKKIYTHKILIRNSSDNTEDFGYEPAAMMNIDEMIVVLGCKFDPKISVVKLKTSDIEIRKKLKKDYFYVVLNKDLCNSWNRQISSICDIKMEIQYIHEDE